jgi:hypothetical protein
LEGFDPYAQAGQIIMQPVHQHFIVRRQAQEKELPVEQA